MIRDIYENLSWDKRLKVLRAAYGWSQTEAAEKCFTSQKLYWAWENGKNYPSKRSKKIIADAFGMRIEEIFSDRDKDVKNTSHKGKKN